ncbi:LysM peptidoglycan-binding domain-containing protein [Humisphaera borealis]|uniref:LysM peptidoglycan-binding domain-containing protein n=1 Tax=Humisphaera borealis TaxID=2807512 RepID=A0A7M2X4P0_9BACT|nr:LysM domain-containing protein [Humisphaera borealis]QOV91740.1 LysM peptidoglycan-binding domain-containing protein [Humisphaera borealis]
MVRNHTENQANLEVEGTPVAVSDGSATPPVANVPAVTGVGGAKVSTVILPPLQPVAQGTAQPKPAADPFDRRPANTPAAPPAATVGGPRRSTNNWDSLLAEGRREPVSSAALNHTPPPSVTADPIRQVTNVEPIAPRPAQVSGLLSTATGKPYVIRQGDTFSSVAKQAYGAEKYYLQIEQANPNVNTMRLKPGQQIILPELPAEARATRTRTGPFNHEGDNRPVDSRTEYRVDTGDSLYRISMKLYGTPRMCDAIYEANRAAIGENPDRLRLGMILRVPRAPDGK